MDRFFTRIATAVSAAVGQPWAFIVAALSIIIWACSGPLFGFSEDRKSTRLNSSHRYISRMPSSA
jgi:low affinity Fe/Cu permease